MHPGAYDWLAEHIGDTAKLRILEIGSRDVNGSPRPLCEGAAEYIGIDVREGRGVDQVVAAADYDGKGAFDLVISSEALEHTPDPQEIIACARRALKTGGRLLITAAAPDRAPHSCDGYPTVPDDEHYANIEPDELQAWLADWSDVTIEHHAERGDVYAQATRVSRRAKKTDE